MKESLRKLEEIENRIRGQKAEAHARGFLENIAKQTGKTDEKSKIEKVEDSEVGKFFGIIYVGGTLLIEQFECIRLLVCYQ